MTVPVQLVFYGEVIDGFAVDDVKRTLGQLFKLDEARVAQMFSGVRVIINRSVTEDEAAHHMARFARVGARLHTEVLVQAPMAEPAPGPGPVPAAAAAAPPPSPAAARRRVPASPSGPALWGLGFEGRVGRLACASAGSMLLAVLLLLFVFLLKRPSTGRAIVSVLGLLIVTFMSVRLSALRCHDCNRSGWWSVLTAVPYAGTVVGLLLSLVPGTAQANDFGEPPDDGSWPLALGGVALLAVAAVMSVPTLLAAMSSGRGLPGLGGHDAAAESAALKLLSSPARSAFLTEYARAPEHKAFAVSPGGAWGWKSGEFSDDSAVRAALASCSANRRPTMPECVPINVDGIWLAP